MSEEAQIPAAKINPSLAALRGRIAWICQAVRIAALAWLLWGVATNVWIRFHRSEYFDKGLRFNEIDPASITDARYWAAFVLIIAVYAAAAFMVYRLWLLMQGYLDGDIFSVEAAGRLRRVALSGFAATAANVILPPLQLALMSTALFSKIPLWRLVAPDNLLYALLCGFFLALSAIFRAAAEIADEHAQFV